jgi:hypothetical protein
VKKEYRNEALSDAGLHFFHYIVDLWDKEGFW